MARRNIPLSLALENVLKHLLSGPPLSVNPGLPFPPFPNAFFGRRRRCCFNCCRFLVARQGLKTAADRHLPGRRPDNGELLLQIVSNDRRRSLPLRFFSLCKRTQIRPFRTCLEFPLPSQVVSSSGGPWGTAKVQFAASIALWKTGHSTPFHAVRPPLLVTEPNTQPNIIF